MDDERPSLGPDVRAESPGSPDPGSPGAGATAEATPELIEHRLAGIERALERLEDGSYWHCEVCGASLPADLLEADPARSRCGAHEGPPGASGQGG